MKFSFSPLARLAATAVIALSLGSCNRAEYALLPKSPAYLGTQASSHRAVAVAAPAALATPVTPAPAAQQEIAATPAPATPTAAIAPAAVASPEAAPAKAAAVAAAATTATPATAPKSGLLQLAIAKKAVKKMGHLMTQTQRASHHATAATSRLDGKLRQGLILLLIGLLVGILGGAVGGSIGNLIGLLGLIIAIVGIVLIILYLFDNL